MSTTAFNIAINRITLYTNKISSLQILFFQKRKKKKNRSFVSKIHKHEKRELRCYNCPLTIQTLNCCVYFHVVCIEFVCGFLFITYAFFFRKLGSK